MNQLLGENECEILTHSQQQSQAPKYQNHNALGPPRGLFFTGLRTQLKSSARHTLSNQQAQVKA